MKSHKLLVTAGLIGLGVVTLWSFFGLQAAPNTSNTVSAATETNQQDSQKVVAAEKPASYTYEAQPGDSYSVLARKAVQTYGIINKVNLSLAQIIAAETNLTIEAGSPMLNEGETVNILVGAIKSAVEAAQKLSAEQQAEWQYYVADVDFNTNRAGEAS